MNIAAAAHRFFLFGGALLVVIALIQLRLRRQAKDPSAGPFDAGMMRILLFATVGILAVLVGAGVIPMARLR